MAYNLPNLTPAQLALPLRVGSMYKVPNWPQWHDLELRAVNEALGTCIVSSLNRRVTRVMRLSELRARYVPRWVFVRPGVFADPDELLHTIPNTASLERRQNESNPGRRR